MQALSFMARKAALIVASLVILPGTVLGDEPKSAVSKPTVHRLEIYNGAVPEVRYFVQGGSSHLEALARLRSYTENQVTLAEELQRLKLELVASDRQLTSARTTYELGQLGQGPRIGVRGFAGPVGGSIFGSSLLGLDEAHYPAAVQLIRDFEQLQTEMAAELKKGPPAAGRAPQSRGETRPREEVLARSQANLQNTHATWTSPSSNGAKWSELVTRPAVPEPVNRHVVLISSAQGISRVAYALHAPQLPSKPSDKERAKLDEARKVLDEERDVLEQERAEFTRLSKDPMHRSAAQQRWQAACQRWSTACRRWSEACREWSDVCAQRAAAQRMTAATARR